MNEFMKILLSLSVSGTLLLLLILGLKPLYKNRFSKRWQYYIWIVAALRFLIPFTPDTTIVGSLFGKFDTAAVNETASPHGAIPAGTGDGKAGPIQTNRDMAASMREPVNKYVCLFFIWSALTLVLFVRKVTVYQGFIRYIKAGNKEVSDIEILNLLSGCEEKLNIKTGIELSRNPLIASPMLIGFFRPGIILPVGELEDKELSHIFMHELIHYKQRDMFYKWLIQIVVCVHWFNPFVYLLEKEVNKSCELSCDEKVISVLDDTARREYGDILISFLKSNNLYKSSLASVTLTEGAEQLKERLGAIMKFRKKSKAITAVTAIFTAVVCVSFFAVGAYAAPSAVNDRKMWKNSEIRNEILTEDGVYYIFCDGAEEDDKPLASVSTGNIMFVLVRKDGYTSVGPFGNMETLMEDVAGQCENMNTLTQEEKELVMDTAAIIVKNDKSTQYTFTQKGYYCNSYIIEMGWNLSDTLSKEYAVSKEITLEDNSVIKAYFDERATDYLKDSNAVSAIGKLIYSLNNGDMQNNPMIEIPLITNITYVSEKNLSILAEEYFQKSSLTEFSAIFPGLDRKLQKEYCEKIYDENKIAFFSSILPYMDRDLVTLYADQSDRDQKVNFLSVVLGYIQPDDRDQYAEKYYETDNVSCFTIVVDYMTKEERQEWLKRARTDKKTNFATVLSDELPD